MRPLLSRIQNFLQTRSPVFILILGFIFVLLLGVIDYFTGGGRAFDFAYLLPVFLVSWYVGLRAGIFTASLTVLTVVISSDIEHLPINWSEIISTAILMLAIYIFFVALVYNLKSNSRKLAGTLSVLNATLDSTLDGILVVDKAGKIVSYNRRFSEMWKIPAALLAAGDDDKTLAYVLDQLINPDAFVLKVKELDAQVEARSFDVLEFKDGRTFERFSQPQRVDERIVGRVWSFRDMTHRLQAEKGLKESEFELRALFAAMPDTILIMDQDGRFLKMAPADPGHIRQPAEKMVGKTLHEIYPKEQADEFLRKIHSAIQTGHTGHFEYTLPFMEQNTWYSASVSPMTGNTILWVARDITERKQAEALQDAVYRIATATETTRSLEDLFPQIHQIISSVMPADNFYITLYDELHQTLRFPFNTDAVDTPYLGEIQTGKGKTSYVLRTGKSLLCTKEVHEELVKRGDVIFLGVPSAIWLGVPLITEGKTIGAMVVQHYTDPNAYTVREQHMLEFVSTQVAIAITRKQAEKALENSEAELRALFAAMTDVVIVYDRDGHYREIVPADPNIQVAHPNQLIGKSLYDVFPQDDADRHLQNIRTVLETGIKMETEYILRVTGRSIWFACTISPLQADAVIWVAHDITNRIQAEKVQEAIYAISDAAISTESIEELYHSIHTSLAELIHVENFFIALYDPMRDMISFPYFVDQYDPAPQETKPRRGLTEYVMRTGQPLLAPNPVFDELVRLGEVESMGADSVDWLGVPLKVEGQVIGVMVTQSYQEDIHFAQEDLRLFEFVSTQVAQMIDRKRTEQKIRYLGIHDSLTGLYNRAYFDEELSRLQNGRLFPVSILMADLDDLKEVNDSKGHAAGDELLRQAAKALRSAFRLEDVVARIGGDEFAVLLPGIDSSKAEDAKRRIAESIMKQNASDAVIPLQLSMGVSTIEKGGSLLDALKSADDMMYVEKQGKR